MFCSSGRVCKGVKRIREIIINRKVKVIRRSGKIYAVRIVIRIRLRRKRKAFLTNIKPKIIN